MYPDPSGQIRTEGIIQSDIFILNLENRHNSRENGYVIIQHLNRVG